MGANETAPQSLFPGPRWRPWAPFELPQPAVVTEFGEVASRDTNKDTYKDT